MAPPAESQKYRNVGKLAALTPQRFGLKGTFGAGPSHRSQSRSAGGSPSGGLPKPFCSVIPLRSETGSFNAPAIRIEGNLWRGSEPQIPIEIRWWIAVRGIAEALLFRHPTQI